MSDKGSGKLYYGLPKTGKRIHFGSEVLFADQKRRRGEWVVVALCGAQITSHDPDRPTPARVSEFCRNCFRSEAWGVYEQELLRRAEDERRVKHVV